MFFFLTNIKVGETFQPMRTDLSPETILDFYIAHTPVYPL